MTHFIWSGHSIGCFHYIVAWHTLSDQVIPLVVFISLLHDTHYLIRSFHWLFSFHCCMTHIIWLGHSIGCFHSIVAWHTLSDQVIPLVVFISLLHDTLYLIRSFHWLFSLHRCMTLYLIRSFPWLFSFYCCMTHFIWSGHSIGCFHYIVAWHTLSD